ncbi:MAG: FHA domain-containing protein [Planctomycetaceae bacterium]|nr:FHA domain-containing protein [Planctomycetaceae bacterium]
MRSPKNGQSDSAYARLVIERDQGPPILKDVNRATTLIGSAPGCNIQLISTIVAPAHAVITRERDQFRLRDLRTINGTAVNGEKTELTTLNDGDTIRIGGIPLRFETNLYQSSLSEQADTQLLMALHHEPSAATNISHDYTVDEADRLRRGSAFARLKFTHSSGSVGYKDILRNSTLIGSAPGSNIQLVAEDIAPAHALFTLESDQLVLRDLRTKVGTRLNGRRIEVHELKNNDRIEIGNFLFTLETNLSEKTEDVNSLTDTQYTLPAISPVSELPGTEPDIPLINSPVEKQRPSELEQTQEIKLPSAEKNSPSKNVIADQLRRNQLEQLLHDIHRREERCQEQEENLNNRKTEIERREQELNARTAELDSAESRLLKTAQDFRLQYDEFQERNTTRDQLDEQSRSLEELEASLIARQTAQDLKQVELNEHETKILHEKEQLEQAHAEIHEKQEELQYQLSELQKQTDLINTRKDEIVARVQKLESNEAILETAQQQLEEAKQKLAERQQSVEQLQNELEEQQARFQAELTENEQKQSAQSSEIEILTADLSDQQTKIESQRQEIETLSQQIVERNQKLLEREETLQQTEKQLTSQEEELALRQSELEETSKEFQAREENLQKQVQDLEQLRKQYQADRQKLQTELERLETAIARQKAEQQQFREQHQQLANWKENLRQGLESLEKGRIRYWKLLRLDARESVNDVSIAKSLLIHGKITRYQAEWMINGRFPTFNIEHYQVQSLLDTGGMGWLYKGIDTRTNKPVALKLINRQSLSDNSLLTRFQLEAKAGLRVKHPNVINTLELGENELFDYLATELIEGINLSEYRELHEKLPWQQACDFALQTARGLKAIHDANMIHRDIKPSNLVIDDGGNVKILDFGLALISEEEDEFTLAMIYGHDCVGTADYIAPEQSIDSFQVGPQADFYSLGCTLYLWLAGRVPFPAKPIREKLDGHRHQEPTPLEELTEGIPTEVIAIVRKLMAKEPTQRYQSADEISELLSPFAVRQHCWFDYPAILMVRSAEARARIRIQAKSTSDVTNELPGSTNDIRREEKATRSNQ